MTYEIFETSGVKYQPACSRPEMLAIVSKYVPGTTDETLNATIHMLFERHLRKPPHLSNKVDEAIQRVLVSLVDYSIHFDLNPVDYWPEDR